MATRKGAKVIAMPTRENDPPAADQTVDTTTAWGALGFASEREMLIDDLKELNQRIKSSATTATAVAALSKRKHEVFEQIKMLDAGDDDPDDILDDSEDESWDVGG
ncbi:MULTISPECIES: hypothetical protein [Mycobacteroides]|jgi:hypothetical protein|nr:MULTISPECIES: hypothetical protein [Mycobacteroides]MBF9523049.1 hypothetical protein [Mycobacteroides chelonae]